MGNVYNGNVETESKKKTYYIRADKFIEWMYNNERNNIAEKLDLADELLSNMENGDSSVDKNLDDVLQAVLQLIPTSIIEGYNNDYGCQLKDLREDYNIDWDKDTFCIIYSENYSKFKKKQIERRDMLNNIRKVQKLSPHDYRYNKSELIDYLKATVESWSGELETDDIYWDCLDGYDIGISVDKTIGDRKIYSVHTYKLLEGEDGTLYGTPDEIASFRICIVSMSNRHMGNEKIIKEVF